MQEMYLKLRLIQNYGYIYRLKSIAFANARLLISL